MTALSAAIGGLWSKVTPRSPRVGKLELPSMDDEPPASETCELRIEGMTCAACVKVRAAPRAPAARAR